MKCPRRAFLARTGSAFLLLATVAVGAKGDTLPELKAMSLEQLLDVEATSVSRRPQKSSEAAAALFVITRDDIRRSGASSIPELLRMVPGVDVARIDGNKWAISVRGFNGRFANKLLVLVDGRSVYTPLDSGVFWDAQDTMLDDIERIEVIRGPGATLWGANAVNGIINIITRSANDTRGGLLVLGAGSEEQVSASARYGAALGETGSLRLYAKGFERRDNTLFDGSAATDGWDSARTGFRADFEPTSRDALTVQGDYYSIRADQTLLVPGRRPDSRSVTGDLTDAEGGNLLARWSRRLSDGSGLDAQFYLDRTERANTSLSEERDTLDLDFQHWFPASERQALIWGFGYRQTRDRLRTPPGSPLVFANDERDSPTFSAFVQDDIALVPEQLHLILGTKYERNDYTGDEWQPSVRALWTPEGHTTWWASVSRAVRTPSRFESDFAVNVGAVRALGNPALLAERLIAYEVGLRLQPAPTLALDLVAFYNDYDDLVTTELVGRPFPPPVTLALDNRMSGHSKGIELAAVWDIDRRWRIKTAYTWLDVALTPDPGSTDTASAAFWNRAPPHQLHLRSLLDLGPDLELDTTLRYVAALPDSDIESYLELDLRLGWRPLADLELELIGSNLLDAKHPEFVELSGNVVGSAGVLSTQVERSVLARLKWSF